MSTECWAERAEALRAELVAAGKLTSPQWQAAVRAVPRHRFVPEFYQRGSANPGWELVSASLDGTRDRWWEGVYANASLVTRIGEISHGTRVTSGPTSSSSAPGLMTRMLEALDVRDGQRVLEIGTGSGYNAALMSHRLGDQNVFTVESNPDVANQARGHLAALGYHPTVVTADGAFGLPEHAPYDRLIATCAVSRVPPSCPARPHPELSSGTTRRGGCCQDVEDLGEALVDLCLHRVEAFGDVVELADEQRTAIAACLVRLAGRGRLQVVGDVRAQPGEELSDEVQLVLGDAGP